MEKHFEEIDFLQKKHTGESNSSIYRIYTTIKEFIDIEAGTALEAIRKSGIQSPYRVIKANLTESPVLGGDKLENVDEEEASKMDTARIKRNVGSDVSGLIETDFLDLPEID